MPPQVAKEIISYCSSCKRDVMHTIVAMKEDRIVRVLCRSCKKEHAFRRAPDQYASAGKRSTQKSSPRKSVSTPDWETEMAKFKGATAKPYAMTSLFDEGQKVAHSTFGTGIVQRLISSDKMEVLFEAGIKVLIRGSSRT